MHTCYFNFKCYYFWKYLYRILIAQIQVIHFSYTSNCFFSLIVVPVLIKQTNTLFYIMKFWWKHFLNLIHCWDKNWYLVLIKMYQCFNFKSYLLFVLIIIRLHYKRYYFNRNCKYCSIVEFNQCITWTGKKPEIFLFKTVEDRLGKQSFENIYSNICNLFLIL